MTHRLRLTVPADHQVAFELPAEITGEVDIVVTPVERPDSPEVVAASVAISRALLSTSPIIKSDVTAMLREDRDL